MDLQTALAGIAQHVTPATPKTKTTPKLPRRLAVGSFDGGRKAVDTTGEVGRHSESRPPPEHAPGFSEYQCNPHRIHLTISRALRLWSNTEIK